MLFYRAENLCYQNKTDKTSCRNFARLSAWCLACFARISDIIAEATSLLKRRLGYGKPPQMSFRGAKRRGNPLNRNANTVAIAIDLACFRNFYRATTLHSQNETDKNSNRNSVRVLAWCVRLWRKWNIPNLSFVIASASVAIYRSELRLTARFPRSLCSLGMTRVGNPHPIVMLSEVETSPGKGMM